MAAAPSAKALKTADITAAMVSDAARADDLPSLHHAVLLRKPRGCTLDALSPAQPKEKTKMAAYILVNVKVTDAARYDGYRQLAQRAVERHGGRYLARGGETVTLEGGWQPDRIVVLEFPTLERAREFYHSPEYAAAREQRRGSCEMKMIAVAGV
jgi:uncharacterized protein (DUF1330 family)